MGNLGTHAASMVLYPNRGYDPVADFEPIGLIASLPLFVGAKKSLPINDFKGFVTYLKEHQKTHELRLGRHRIERPHDVPLHEPAARRRGAARSLSGVGPGADRAARRRHRLCVRRRGGDHRADHERQREAAWWCRRRSGLPRCPTCRPRPSRASRRSRRSAGTCCSPPRARRRRSWTGCSAPRRTR